MNSEETKMILNELSAFREEMNTSFKQIDERLKELEYELKKISDLIPHFAIAGEDEINKKIQLIAEGRSF